MGAGIFCCRSIIDPLDIIGMNYYNVCMNSIVSEKGQITIPKKIRNQLGLVPGTVLDIRSENGKMIGVKQQPIDLIRKWRGKGKLSGYTSTDEYLQDIR